ncbi:uncharacterized protein BJ212DRAFT_1449690 [Suillus subaureus]|uniref:Protein-S-isoprenylcysteine O-methyltransferase n=1 Tax=Suillus subaureus TaxID=48587 RepID=A0A9P7J647_9AGAM|nr:uncharacterized protein BJ212DRAFT_1449690 [Suillus subaureus]KAG1804645.1 hypothetical protein BJ212DRAFT_1449690 [Suillus subaureus]
MESLLKIPLILSPPIAMHVAFTPPHTPTSDDVVHENLIEWILLRDIKYGLPITKAISWAIAFTELAITASHATDPNIFPNKVQAVIGSLRVIQDVSITSPFLCGTALIVLGGFIRWWCFRTLGRFFTFKLSVRKGHQLVTSGPYRVVRHPSYAGAALLTIGQFILHGSPSSLVRHSGILNIPALKAIAVVVLMGRMIVVACLILRIKHEDEVVKSISRAEWENWAKVVKYRLVPGIY